MDKKYNQNIFSNFYDINNDPSDHKCETSDVSNSSDINNYNFDNNFDISSFDNFEFDVPNFSFEDDSTSECRYPNDSYVDDSYKSDFILTDDNGNHNCDDDCKCDSDYVEDDYDEANSFNNRFDNIENFYGASNKSHKSFVEVPSTPSKSSKTSSVNHCHCDEDNLDKKIRDTFNCLATQFASYNKDISKIENTFKCLVDLLCERGPLSEKEEKLLDCIEKDILSLKNTTNQTIKNLHCLKDLIFC